MAHHITDKCSGCRACVGNCPTGAIQGDGCAQHTIDPSRCIDCGVCGGVCPDEAIRDHHGECCVEHHGLRARAWIDLSRCTGCGACVEACPFDAMERVSTGGDGHRPKVYAGRCLACGACEIDCVHDAIRIQRAPFGQRLKVVP